MTPSPRVRLVDLAAELNLAPSTVSRALAGSDLVAESTRKRVVEAADAVGYTANPVATGLKLGNTSSIGLIAPMNYWYAGEVTSGADRIAAARGYDFVVMNSGGGTSEELLTQRARRLGRRVDGALVVDIDEHQVLPALIAALGVPVVTLGCRHPGTSAILVDNEAIGQAAATHLHRLGHRRAAVFSVENPSSIGYDNAGDRAVGFAGAFEHSTPVLLPHDDPAQRRAMIAAALHTATAAFCTQDALAIEVVALLRDRGASVPEQYSVLGVDDHPLADAVGLTTISQDPKGMGDRATNLLIDRIAGATERHVEIFPTTLVPRRTTAPAVACTPAVIP